MLKIAAVIIIIIIIVILIPFQRIAGGHAIQKGISDTTDGRRG